MGTEHASSTPACRNVSKSWEFRCARQRWIGHRFDYYFGSSPSFVTWLITLRSLSFLSAFLYSYQEVIEGLQPARPLAGLDSGIAATNWASGVLEF